MRPSVSAAVLAGALLLSVAPAWAKTSKECNAEYSANKAAIKVTQKKADFIAACKAGTEVLPGRGATAASVAPAPAQPPSQTATPAPAPAPTPSTPPAVVPLASAAATPPTTVAAKSPDCPDDPHAVVTAAYKAPTIETGKPVKEVALGDAIILEISHLPELLRYRDCKAAGKEILLAVNDRSIPEATASPLLDSAQGKMEFEINPGESNRKQWLYSLGRPDFQTRPIRVSVAIQDEPAISSAPAATLKLRVLDPFDFGVWATGFVVLLGLFFWLARRSNILRGEPPDIAPDSPNVGQYSLARVQAAWWLFVILGAYALIGLVTGDYRSSVNGTALILLGIGAATSVASAAIDASKPVTTAEKQATQAKITTLTAASAVDNETEINKLKGKSRGILLDVLSDANGVGIHRFQAVAWTLALTIVFCREVYLNLAMADFSDTLLGLQGLSAATYLGVKTTEAKVAS